MSFSSDVKAELSKQSATARHCQIAELAAMISMVAEVVYLNEIPIRMQIVTERSVIAKTISSLIWKLFRYNPDVSIRRVGENSRQYFMIIDESEAIIHILQTLKIQNENTHNGREKDSCQIMKVSKLVLQKECCKSAYVKGIFMASGSVSNPEKSYHFELVCENENRAEFIKNIINEFGIDCKVTQRKKYHIAYIKDGDMIVQMLGVMGAHISLMNMENIRIIKEISNNTNRRVNCEAANLNKTVTAAVKQMEDINYIISTKGISFLPDNLRELAVLRLEEEDASLKELGEMMSPPLGKSGVNHRLRKISEIADKLREA